MRDRLTTFIGALLALIVVYGLFFGNAEQPSPVTRPLTIERGGAGYFAFQQWLVAGGVKTYSLRRRFSTLYGNSEVPKETGNILVTTLPYSRPMREAESGFLSDWIADGNTLLVLAAINDTPDWVPATPTSQFLADLATITGVYFRSEYDEAPAPQQDSDEDEEETIRTPILIFDDSGSEQEYAITPKTGHPLMNGISGMQAMSNFVSSVWRAEVGEYELVLELATVQQTNTAAIWQKTYGDGQIIIVGSGSLLTNKMIASADNRKFVANLVQLNLDNGATVIFDDLHQGLSSIYDPDAFFSDSRLHYTIYFIIGFWLLYVVGSSNRLLEPRDAGQPVRQTDFVEATAGFIKRRMSISAVGLWMYRSWFNELRRHMRLPLNGEPVWNELGTLRTLDERLLSKLKLQYRDLTKDKKISLIELHNTIHDARRAIG